MASSQNGYPVVGSGTTGAMPRLRKWVVPGTGRHLLLRDGSAGFLLVHYAMWYHSRVEKLDAGVWDDWGWASRPIRGSATISNHASGTAMDLNATRHPLGVSPSDTFTSAQIRRIRRRLRVRFGAGVIRWGGDYLRRPDGMHYEVVAPLARCERLARRLMRYGRGKRILEVNPGAEEVILS